MAIHSSVLAWRIPGRGEPGELLSMGLHKSWTRLKQLSSSSRSFSIEPQFKSQENTNVCVLLWTPILGI